MKKRKYRIARITIIGMILLCCVYYFISHYDRHVYTIENAEDYVKKICEIGDVPGMSIVALDNGQEYYFNAGYADKNEKTEMTSEVRCELGSTTKAFTGLAVLLLEQEGKLDRKDAVKDYIAWFQPTYQGKYADITIEQLLCHTSGIPTWTIANLPVGTGSDTGLLETTVKGIQTVKLDHAPGTVHQYATINYDVLALIIENVSGMTYEEYVWENVLEPLGMKNSYFRTDDTKLEQLAQGYRYAFLGTRKYDAPTFYGNTAAGYLVSNTTDLAIWMKAQMGTLELRASEKTDKLQRAIAASHSYPIVQGQRYFAGWNLYDDYICHGGNNPNYSSQVYIGKTNGKAVFALANIFGSAPTKAADGIYRMLQGESISPGFLMDGHSLLDWLCVIVCLIELYVMILLLEHRERRRAAKGKAYLAAIIAVILAFVPYMLHYNYFAMMVWFSPCVIIAIVGVELCFAEYILFSFCHLRRQNVMNGRGNQIKPTC